MLSTRNLGTPDWIAACRDSVESTGSKPQADALASLIVPARTCAQVIPATTHANRALRVVFDE